MAYKDKSKFSVFFRIKHFFALLMYSVFIWYIKVFRNKNIIVKNIEDSLKDVKDKNLSIGRFGDGEFKWMFGDREEDNFEKNSAKIAENLRRIINVKREDFVVCIPDIFNGLNQYRYKSSKFWAGQIVKHGYKWIKVLDNNYIYLDSLITRPYMIYQDKSNSGKLFNMFKSIWRDKEVLIIEGNETRFGIGNDLLSTSKNISRIICPSKNAFESYDLIYEETIKELEKRDLKNTVVLVSLGPTATILAHDVSLSGAQVIDIGHLDIEYDWYLMGVEDKTKIPFKYVNEVKDGDKVKKLPDDLTKKYESEIVRKVR